jgi:hypothetical protein|tara:strand:- start:290 stop:622 length:333 start_codon:yes stop_codon:yes gene_type:complete
MPWKEAYSLKAKPSGFKMSDEQKEKISDVKRGYRGYHRWGDVKFLHNLYDIIGLTLYEGFKHGKLDPRSLERFSTILGVDLGGNYGASIGHNEYMGNVKQKFKATISKKF